MSYPEPEVEDDDGNVTKLPFKYEVCYRCKGHGSHTNPAIDGHGLDPHDPDLDSEFWETYMSGGYDVVCEECGGMRVVKVVDEDNTPPALLAQWHRDLREIDSLRQMERMERLMGA